MLSAKNSNLTIFSLYVHSDKVCDAVEVAGRNVMSTTSVVTTELVSQRYVSKNKHDDLNFTCHHYDHHVFYDRHQKMFIIMLCH